MRKNSWQIYQEILLEEAINSFEHKDKLKQYLDDMFNFRINELDAMYHVLELVKGNDSKILNNYVVDKIIEHARNITAILGVTVEGFKVQIEDLEEKRKSYEQSRNSILASMDRKFV